MAICPFVNKPTCRKGNPPIPPQNDQPMIDSRLQNQQGPSRTLVDLLLWNETHLICLHLLEESHNLVEDIGESVKRLIACFNHVSILGSVQVEKCQPAATIFIKQC